MHFLSLALSRWLGQIAMQNSEYGMGAAGWARAKHLSEGHPECENWQIRSREMMSRGKTKTPSERMVNLDYVCPGEFEKKN
jgi:hypothetical protein